MCKFKSTLLKVGRLVASLVLFLGVSSTGIACISWFHQPKVPEKMSKFTK